MSDQDLLTRLAHVAIKARNDGSNEIAALLDAAHHTLSSLDPARRLRLAAGDTVVVKASQRLTQAQGQKLQDYVGSRVPEGVKTMVLENDVDLIALKQSDEPRPPPLSGAEFADNPEVLLDDLRTAAFEAGAAGDENNDAMFQATDAIRNYLFCRSISPAWMKLMIEVLTHQRSQQAAAVRQVQSVGPLLEPADADQAEAMAKAGMAWLALNAPERIAAAQPTREQPQT